MCAATQKPTGMVQSAWPPLTTMPLRTALTPISPLMVTSYKPIPPVCTWIFTVSIQPKFETISDGGSHSSEAFEDF
eukprot:scaffold56975_cov61-Attheya_sp.AAC.1